MKGDNENKKGLCKELAAGILGGIFFAISYSFLEINFLISFIIGVIAYFAGIMIFTSNSSDNTSKKVTDDVSNILKQQSNDPDNKMKNIIQTAKGQNQLILSMVYRVEIETLKNNIIEVNKLAEKIIDTVEKNPQKYEKAKSFFTYYLPVTLKILAKYDDIEDSNLDTKETKDFMTNTEAMFVKIKNSFKKQLSNLYAADMMDADAEMKVFETMLNSEGISTTDDFSNLNTK